MNIIPVYQELAPFERKLAVAVGYSIQEDKEVRSMIRSSWAEGWKAVVLSEWERGECVRMAVCNDVLAIDEFFMPQVCEACKLAEPGKDVVVLIRRDEKVSVSLMPFDR